MASPQAPTPHAPSQQDLLIHLPLPVAVIYGPSLTNAPLYLARIATNQLEFILRQALNEPTDEMDQSNFFPISNGSSVPVKISPPSAHTWLGLSDPDIRDGIASFDDIRESIVTALEQYQENSAHS